MIHCKIYLALGTGNILLKKMAATAPLPQLVLIIKESIPIKADLNTTKAHQLSKN